MKVGVDQFLDPADLRLIRHQDAHLGRLIVEHGFQLIFVLEAINSALEVIQLWPYELNGVGFVLLLDLLLLVLVSYLSLDLHLGIRLLLWLRWALVPLLLDLLEDTYQLGVLVPSGKSWTLVHVDAGLNVVVGHSAQNLDLRCNHREALWQRQLMEQRLVCYSELDWDPPDLLVGQVLDLLGLWECLLHALHLLVFPTGRRDK